MAFLKNNRKPVIWALAGFGIYLALAIILTWPLASNMSTHYFSAEVPGDGMGTIAQSWLTDYSREEGSSGPVTALFGYPFGYDLRGAPVYPLSGGIMHQLTRIAGAQASYNILVLLSFPLAGLAMFVLVHYLTGRTSASFLGGLLYSFSPWLTSRTFQHASLSGVYVLPLFMLAVIVFTRRRDIASALALCGAWVMAVYTDYHFGLFCLLLAVTWTTVVLFHRKRKDSGRATSCSYSNLRATDFRFIVYALLVILVTLAVSFPFILDLSYEDPTAIANADNRGDVEAIAEFSANPWNYVVPPGYSAIWRRFTGDYVRTHLGKRTIGEVTSYPGIAVMILSIAALLLFRSRNSQRTAPDDKNPGLVRVVAGTCVAAGVASFILSLPPVYDVGSALIPTPSIIVSSLVPFFRYYCRWAIVVTFCACLLAGIGYSLLVSRLRNVKLAVLAVFLLAVSVFLVDVSAIPPLRSFDISRPPETLQALAGYQKSEPVVIYPLAQGHEYATLHYRYYQMDHLHPMLNGIKPATEADLYRLALKDIYSPYTPRMLETLGIDKAVVLTDYYEDGDFGNYPYGVRFDPALMPDGYTLVEKTGDGYIYAVDAIPATVFPLYYRNISPPSILEDGRAWSLMLGQEAELLLENVAGPDDYTLTMNIINPGVAGTLSFVQAGQVLGSLELDPGQCRITSPVFHLEPGTSSVFLAWSEDPIMIHGTPFRLAETVQAYLILSGPELAVSPSL
jgi:hypothetical protein